MSEYQKIKARALEAQKEREREIQYELEAKAERIKVQRREEEERKKRQEAASREARTLELKRANEAINKGKLEAQKEEYNPFAEVERQPRPLTNVRPKLQTTLATKSKPSGSSFLDIPRPPMTIAKPKKSTSQKDKEKEVSPPALGRKEKAAKALMESAKRSGASSIFSVKSNQHAGPSRVSSGHMGNRLSNSSHTQIGNGVKGKGKGQNGLRGDGDLRALCPDRGQRDNRTIDQIQRDIKARKAGGNITQNRDKGTKSKSPDKKSLPTPTKPGIRPPSRPSKRSPSPTPSTSSESTASSDGGRSRKKPKRNDEKTKVSAMIQELFRRPDRPPPRPVYSDEESGSDMEAGLSDVEEEEQRALRVARREDELAEREERERKARKEKLRREREGR